MHLRVSQRFFFFGYIAMITVQSSLKFPAKVAPPYFSWQYTLYVS